jgi:hypothetical protein
MLDDLKKEQGNLSKKMECQSKVKAVLKKSIKDFIIKLKRKQKIGIVLSAGISLFCMYGLYNMEYCVDVTNTASLEQAADEALDYFHFEAEFIESKKVGRTLFVQLRNISESSEKKQAVLQLDHGLFGKYRIRSALRSDWALYINTIAKVGFKDYLIISGVKDPLGAETFKLFMNDRPPGYPSGLSENKEGIAPVYEGKTSPQIFLITEVSKEEAEGLRWPFSIRYYDENGNELEKSEVAAHYDYDGSMEVGGSTGHGPSTLYVFLALVLFFGIILIRYFALSNKAVFKWHR